MSGASSRPNYQESAKTFPKFCRYPKSTTKLNLNEPVPVIRSDLLTLIVVNYLSHLPNSSMKTMCAPVNICVLKVYAC